MNKNDRDSAATNDATDATNDATRDTTARQMTRQSVALSDAARRLGVSLRTVQRRVESGALPSEQRDGRRFVLLESGAPEAATNDATGATKRDNSGPDAAPKETELRAQLDRAHAEISFLRNVIEGQQRDAAETRAALREAQKQNKPQLTQGSATDGPQRAEIASAGNERPTDARAAPKPAKRETATDWNAIYGQIADELEAQELNR